MIQAPQNQKTKSYKDDSQMDLLNWNHLIGYEKTYEKLKDLLQKQTLPQVILFSGRSGIGKSSFIWGLAALCYCTESYPCTRCDACRAMIQKEHPDALWIENDSSQLKLDDAKELQQHLNLKASRSLFNPLGLRIVVIPDIERLNRQASNRLLKILEEPPANCHIFLSTSRPQSISSTLLSRMVKWILPPPPKQDLIEFINEKEKLILGSKSLSAEEKKYICDLNGWSPGKIIRHLKEISEGSQQRDQKAVMQLLNCRSSKEVLERAEALAKDKNFNIKILLGECEALLRQIYRQQIRNHQAVDPNLLRQRRSLLSKLRKWSLNEQVPLNSQLAMEHLGLLSMKQ